MNQLFEGLGLGKTAEDLLTLFPATVGGKDVDAFKFLENVSFLADFTGNLQARMSGHFLISFKLCSMFVRNSKPLKENKIYPSSVKLQVPENKKEIFFCFFP